VYCPFKLFFQKPALGFIPNFGSLNGHLINMNRARLSSYEMKRKQNLFFKFFVELILNFKCFERKKTSKTPFMNGLKSIPASSWINQHEWIVAVDDSGFQLFCVVAQLEKVSEASLKCKILWKGQHWKQRIFPTDQFETRQQCAYFWKLFCSAYMHTYILPLNLL
jgi:hypothetical protein